MAVMHWIGVENRSCVNKVFQLAIIDIRYDAAVRRVKTLLALSSLRALPYVDARVVS